MKTWKDIEMARERRLWAKEIIIPAVLIVTTTGIVLRREIAYMCKKMKDKIVDKFNKKKDSKKEEGQH